ncbi:hypothetical protein [Arthrobacter sp. SO3]|uniref:hypothetical protein n=1 Tax=Arthrobacter sp. SO3 TaxID=1897057 RepID=UPI001D0008BD|nr:hypothetical protein [Arthrobacter sp. SO3]MCB5294600.1 hypothetical protein [Arthrobacter sp. SO3]
MDAGPLRIRAAVGARTRLGGIVRLVPRPLAVYPQWPRALNPLAARLSPGARTAGAGWESGDAGAMAAILPAVTFGFSSVPPEPSLARVRTTVVQPAAGGGS